MKNIAIIVAAVSCILFSASCSSTGLSGKLPIPFTDPAMDAQGVIQVTPLPPKLCIGVDVSPREEPKD
tara:strand:+ start:8753 stop:8956 length:204 start_codon:yes stop_codon:yes gene_type:complete